MAQRGHGPRYIPKRKPHPVGWGILFGAGDEESAEAPPAADEARRFRGSVPAVGDDSRRQPADTTVSAEAHAKKNTTLSGGVLERATRLELATSTLARSRSTR